eukprot:TRINITY_DN4967_c0_g1_i1.p1 TRINITY_DN4967_c0_g1~~TRINITY_DN4967_c0_g1_i1.p1  ORF type:complete len:359 (-),score=151.83 TRINITY_DN4967_c0_g1_i1:714-1718(-)
MNYPPASFFFSAAILLALSVGISLAKNETLVDLPSGSPMIETKVEDLGKIYFGSKLYLRCPLSAEEIAENLRLKEEREDEEDHEEEEDDKEESEDDEKTYPLDDLKWFHDGILLESSKNASKKIRFRKEWVYMESDETDNLMGVFSCQYKDKEIASFRSILALSINKLHTSYNVMEGEDLKLHCQVGDPQPPGFSLSWFYKLNLEDPLIPIPLEVNASTSEEPHLKVLSKDGVPNAVLKIEDAVYEDRAFYYCRGETENELIHLGTLVRVKDKYAALWPFIGILAEVVVLCLIILICDRRAAKKEEEEGEDEDGLSGGLSGNAGSDGSGLRQRK